MTWRDMFAIVDDGLRSVPAPRAGSARRLRRLCFPGVAPALSQLLAHPLPRQAVADCGPAG